MSYWYFTAQERRALLLWAVLMVSTFLLGAALPYVYAPDVADILPAQQALEAFEGRLERADSLRRTQYAQKYPQYTKRAYEPRRVSWQRGEDTPKREGVLSPFDPNTADEAALERLGLPPSAVRAIVNYRSKGGKFRQRSDLGKIYSIPAEMLERLLPFVQLPDTVAYAAAASAPKWALRDSFAAASKQPKVARPAILLDINSAGVEDWQKLPLIGAGRAAQILKYRQKLGGFASVEQIGEIYGMPDSVFQQIRPMLQCVVREGSLRRIALNSATQEELAAHPYISHQQARAIVYYRQQLGQFTRVDFVLTIPELDDARATARRLLPYLSLD